MQILNIKATHHEDAPGVEVLVSALMTELQRRQAVNKHNQTEREKYANLVTASASFDGQIISAKLTVKEFKNRLEEAKGRVEGLTKDKATAMGRIDVQLDKVNNLTDEDESEIQQQITDSEEVNRKVRENTERISDGEIKAEEKNK